MTTPSLPAKVRSLLDEAIRAYQGRPAQATLTTLARHLDGPLRVAIAGRVKAGKSTLLNALVGTRIAATDAGECTRVITWYSRGTPPRATAYPTGGETVGLDLREEQGRWSLDLSGLPAESLDRIEVALPSDWLGRMTLVDTPGLGSLTESAGQRTQDFFGGTGSVDAVLYLLRHLHVSDIDFLDAFQEAGAAETTPVNAVGVLSRADEIGGGTPSALADAGRIAAGYRVDARVRGLVHTVLPVAGLLAETAATLTTADFAGLAALAAVSERTTAPLLLSAARFTAPSQAVPVAARDRERLLDGLGVFGVRLCLEIIRSGVDDVAGLSVALQQRSGLDELRQLLLTRFAQRRDVLKADGALRAIETVTRDDPIPAAPRLRQAVERLRASAHELTEIRLLTDLRTGLAAGPPDQVRAMEKLLGGNGTAIHERLGMAAGTPPADMRDVVGGMHAHWRRVAQNPLTDPALARAAQVLQRTCEGLAAAIRTMRAPDSATLDSATTQRIDPVRRR